MFTELVLQNKARGIVLSPDNRSCKVLHYIEGIISELLDGNSVNYRDEQIDGKKDFSQHVE